MREGTAHRFRPVEADDGQVAGNRQVSRVRPFKDLGSRQVIGGENAVNGFEGVGLVQRVAHHREALGCWGIEGNGKDPRVQSRPLHLRPIAGLAQVVRPRARGEQHRMTRTSLQQRPRCRSPGLLIRAPHVRDGGAEVSVDRHQRHADGVVLLQALVVCARYDPVHAVAHQQGQVLALALRPPHRVADEDAIARLGQGVLNLDGELTEERQRHRRHDEAHRLGAHSVQRARQRVRAVSQSLDRVRDPPLRLLREVSAVVEDPRDGCQTHSGESRNIGQRGFAGTHARFPFVGTAPL